MQADGASGLVLSRVNITGGRSSQGAGLYVRNTATVLTGGSISNGVASGEGGAIYAVNTGAYSGSKAMLRASGTDMPSNNVSWRDDREGCGPRGAASLHACTWDAGPAAPGCYC